MARPTKFDDDPKDLIRRYLAGEEPLEGDHGPADDVGDTGTDGPMATMAKSSDPSADIEGDRATASVPKPGLPSRVMDIDDLPSAPSARPSAASVPGYRSVMANGDVTPAQDQAPEPKAPTKAVIIEKKTSEDDIDPELARLQNRSKDRKKWGLVGLAASNFADAFATPSARTSNSFWDRYIQASDDDVKDYRDRLARTKQLSDERKLKATEAEENDPNSDISQAAIGYLKNVPGGAELAARFKTAAQVRRAFPFMKEQIDKLYDLERTRVTTEANASEKRAKAAAEESERKGILTSMKGGRYAPVREQFGDDWENQPLSVLKNLKSQVDAEHAAAAGAARVDARQESADARRLSEEERKNEHDRQKGMPKGYVATGDMTETQKNKLSVGLSAASRLKLGIADLRKMLKDKTRFLPQDRKSVEAAVMALRLEAKNVAELGAITGPDQKYLEALVANPNDIAEMIFQDPQQRLDQLESWTDRQVKSAEQVFPVRRAPGQKMPSGYNLKSAARDAKVGQTFVWEGKKYRKVNESEIEEAD